VCTATGRGDGTCRRSVWLAERTAHSSFGVGPRGGELLRRRGVSQAARV
jgi:hypothetical protein